MSNLFTSFDPQSFGGISLNWIRCAMALLLMPRAYWLANNHIRKRFILIQTFVVSEFRALMSRNRSPYGRVHITVSMFMFILITNISGLLPYIFPVSSHLPFAIILALPLWIGHILNSWVNTANLILAHLVPLGTPVVLMPFIVLIEIVRSVIRPLTLSIRLVANIVAGHLLLTLLGSRARGIPILGLTVLVITIVLLCFLESGVRLVQAYVFRALSTLYLREVSEGVKEIW